MVIRIVVQDGRGNSSSSWATINSGRSTLLLGITHSAVTEMRSMCKPLRNAKRDKNPLLLFSLSFTVSSRSTLKPLSTFVYSTVWENIHLYHSSLSLIHLWSKCTLVYGGHNNDILRNIVASNIMNTNFRVEFVISAIFYIFHHQPERLLLELPA